jgi:hypothetical protein
MKFTFQYKDVRKKVALLFKGKKRFINSKRNPRTFRIGTSGENEIFFEFLKDRFSAVATVDEYGSVLMCPKVVDNILSVLSEEEVTLEVKDEKLYVTQGKFEAKISYISKEGTSSFKTISQKEDKKDLHDEIAKTEKEILWLREKAHLKNIEISQDEDYNERCVHDKYIYYRRLIKEEEKKLRLLKDKNRQKGG